MKKKIIGLTLVTATLVFIGTQMSCYKDNKEAMYPSGTCDTNSITWRNNIKPIVDNSCAISGCHDASTAAGGYALNTYSGVKKMADNNQFIAVIELGSMPKNATHLDACTINKVRRWINTGALEN
ncbi:MAG: hypothetical protein QM530_07985 [Phycisphaerales bacterium]|nr:hypothetical protein [Phycisphaerales bacterium]